MASWISDAGAMMSISGLAQAASAPQAAGQIKPSPRALAPIAAGSTPATAVTEPSSPSSPSTVNPPARRRQRTDRRHQAERDRQVVVAAFLRQVGGGEVDGDAARRQRQARGDQRGADPLAGFRHRLVGQADDVEGEQPGWACTCTSTARASMPSNATVATRWTMENPCLGTKSTQAIEAGKNIQGTEGGFAAAVRRGSTRSFSRPLAMQQRRDFQRKFDATLRRLPPYVMGTMSMHAHLQSGDVRMNIKAKLILAATAVSLLSTPALAFRDMGDAGGDSAFAVPENHGYNAANSAYRYNGRPSSAYASGQIIRPRYPTQRQRSYQGWAATRVGPAATTTGNNNASRRIHRLDHSASSP